MNFCVLILIHFWQTNMPNILCMCHWLMNQLDEIKIIPYPRKLGFSHHRTHFMLASDRHQSNSKYKAQIEVKGAFSEAIKLREFHSINQIQNYPMKNLHCLVAPVYDP